MRRINMAVREISQNAWADGSLIIGDYWTTE
jgi:hypothetical protein